jgi:hypothetical protein
MDRGIAGACTQLVSLLMPVQPSLVRARSMPPARARHPTSWGAACAGHFEGASPTRLHSGGVEANVTLTPLQRRAARTLALGHSQRVTARKVGCDERTLRRWLSDTPGFREYVEECREMIHDTQPLDVLHELLNSTDERVRLSAAQTLARLPSGDAKPGDEDEDADLGTGW